MSLEQLPPELLHRICDTLENDIPNLRLSCRLLAATGAEYLLPEVHVHYVRESFDMIRAIAQSPVAKGVKSICSHGARLTPLKTFEDWMKARESPDPKCLDRAKNLLPTLEDESVRTK